MYKNLVTLLVLIYSSISYADELSLINSFVECNPSFFNQIYNDKDIINDYTDIHVFNENQAHIAVENRSDNTKNLIYFKKVMKYKELNIKGYYDSAMDLGKIGKYYFWGFIIDNDLDKIKANFDLLDWKTMEDNTLYIANPKIRYITDDINHWKDNNEMEVGVKTVPSPGTTEKLLLLEKGPNMTLLVCSIQGAVTDELLMQERPDIKK